MKLGMIFGNGVKTLDWILQNIFRLPPLLNGHRDEQFRIASPGLSFLRELALALGRCDECAQDQSATDLASLCEIAGIDVPRCHSVAEINVVAQGIGAILSPSFTESEELVVES